MRMDETEGNPEDEYGGREKYEFTQARFPVAPVQVEVESRAAQAPDCEEGVQARIH